MSFLALVVTSLLISPVSKEIPLSEPSFIGAADAQSGVQMASNGRIALAAWGDQRDGTVGVFASRIDFDGRPLDPLGIRIPGNFLDAVIWDDAAFVVITRGEEGVLLTGVREDAHVDEARRIDLPLGSAFLGAASGHLLFTTPRGGAPSNRYSIVSSTGVVEVRDRAIPDPEPPLYLYSNYIAAGRGSEFLLIRPDAPLGGGTIRATAIRIDVTGSILSVVDTGVPLKDFGRMWLAAGASGYLFATEANSSGITAYRLDSSGAFDGRTTSFIRDNLTEVGPSLAADGDRYVFASVVAGANGSYRVMLTDLSSGATSHTTWISEAPLVYASLFPFGGGWIVFASARTTATSPLDLYAQTVDRHLSPSDPMLVAYSAPLQSSVATAATPAGFAVAWAEMDRDDSSGVFVRRFTTIGLAADPAPVEVGRIKNSLYSAVLPDVRIAANDTTIFIAWSGESVARLRRMNPSGSWIDDAPVVIGNQVFAGAVDIRANQSGAMVAFSGISGSERGVFARAIPGAGDLSAAQRIFQIDAASLSIATDGTDFLIAAAETFPCWFECVPVPARVLVTRTKRDATPIVTEPLDLNGGKTYASRVATAFNGHYIVAWSDYDRLNAAAISREGNVIEPMAIIEPRRGDLYPTDVRMAASRSGFILLTKQSFKLSEWTASSFPRELPLTQVASQPRQTISIAPTSRWGSASAAAVDETVLTAFDHPDPAAGSVPRAFLRFFGSNARHRAVHR